MAKIRQVAPDGITVSLGSEPPVCHQESHGVGDEEGWADGDVEGRDGRGSKSRPSPSGQDWS